LADSVPNDSIQERAQDLETLYKQRAEKFGAERERWNARSRLVSNFRGLAFGTLAISLLLAALGKAPGISFSVALCAAFAFAVLIVWHGKVIAAEDDAARWARVNRDGLSRVTDRYRELLSTGAEFADAAHPYVDDLDVFGPSSLFQRISVAHTRFGQRALAEFLRKPASVEVIEARQPAVRALAPLLDQRQRFEALALAVVDPHPQDVAAGARAKKVAVAPDPEPLLRWAEDEPVLIKQVGLVWLARIMPLLTVVGIVIAWKLNQTPAFWIVPLLVHFLLLSRTREITTRVFNAVSETEGAFLRYGALLSELENLNVDVPLIRALQARLQNTGTKPSVAMKQFASKVGWFDLRHNGLIYPFANLFLLWDIHCTVGLERWQASVGRSTRGWFEVLGELEALSSLAGLAHDEPSFSFPEVVSEVCYEAHGLGHPLISAKRRVTNDVTLPAPGTALLVTGSNMSGKSTMLRSMGLACVLAFAGGPVCATRLRMGRLAVRTSIRISDSLDRGVSHFYAEIGKLKAVVDASKQSAPVFFLLDEILHGTNSQERQIGARWVMSELLKRGALGAVSTHDMGLCELSPELMQNVTLVHFRESVQGSQMTFDYRMYPGPVKEGNALRLMRLIGLEVPLNTPSSDVS
jgi:hypothetical protein